MGEDLSSGFHDLSEGDSGAHLEGDISANAAAA